MSFLRSRCALLAAVLTLGACSFGDNLFGPAKGAAGPATPPTISNPASAQEQLTTLSDNLKRQQKQLQDAQAQTAETLHKIDAMLAALTAQMAAQRNAPAAVTAGAAAPAPAAGATEPDRRPLVVLRFDRPNADYGDTLYTALSGALARRPAANFDLVAVAPPAANASEVASNADASKRNLEKVMRSIADMGMPPDRLTLSATTSADVSSSEVRIYVR
jgi:hypothetical protein